MFDSLFKAAVNVVTAPVAVAADVVTLGGSLTDRNETYTGEQLRNLMQNLTDAGDPDND